MGDSNKAVNMQQLLICLMANQQATEQALALITQHQTLKKSSTTPKIEVSSPDTLARIGANGSVQSQSAQRAAMMQQVEAMSQQALAAAHQQAFNLVQLLNGAEADDAADGAD